MRGRSLRIACRCLVALLVAAGAPCAQASAQDLIEHKRILMLFSTRRDSQFAVIGANELPRILDRDFSRDLDYYSEFIDLTRFPETSYKDAFRDFLRRKYEGVRFDLVIAMHDVAIEFLKGNRDSLFRNTPAVYLTNDATTVRPANSTGVVHERDFTGTIALLQQLQPDVRNVFVVTGAAPADHSYENEVRRQLRPSASTLSFTFLSGLATRELEDRLSKLPRHSAVYYVLVTEDGAGDKYHPLEYGRRVAKVANAATYSWVDSALGDGMVGGSLYNQKEAIEQVGHLAVRVLRGDAPETIPITTLDANDNQVDWRQLDKWGIDEARVPTGTVVSFRERSLWDRYRTYILAALAVLTIQTVLIAGLLIQRARRRRAEADLRGSQTELLKSYERNRDLGSRLLKAQETERSRIARELHDDICQRMLLLTIELQLQSRARRDERSTAQALDIAQDIAQDIAKSLHDLSHGLHPTKLQMIGLSPALERLCHELARSGIVITYTHSGIPPTLSPDVMLCLFRVAQEALQNAIKYSHAREVLVDLTGVNGLTLTVSDSGQGFETEAAWGKGVGLFSMVERLEAIGGTFEIVSSPGNGTRLTACVPAHAVQDHSSPSPFAPSAISSQSSSSSIW